MVAGANGSGKSSITRWNPDLLRQFPIIDPDAIARTIQVEPNASSSIEAGKQALREAKGYLESSQSFGVETTLSGHTYLRMMDEARERGFDVILIYIGTANPEINVARVARRVELGGHNVPETDITRRYYRSLRNFPLAMSRADYVILFDNSSTRGYELLTILDHGKAKWFQTAPDWAAQLFDE